MVWFNEFQRILTHDEQKHNALLVYEHFKGKIKNEVIASMVGNMSHESFLNPNMYEFGYEWEKDRGFGLVQWTPRSKMWDWATARGLDPRSGNTQLARLDYEIDQNIQWIANGHQVRYGMGDKYDFSFTDWRSNKPNLSIGQLTEAFMWNYEGPGYENGLNSLGSRVAFANEIYKTIGEGGTITPPGGGGEGGDSLPSRPNDTHQSEAFFSKTEEVSKMFYQVQTGDTLSHIASQTGVRINEIKIAKLTNIPNVNRITEGEYLYIPNKPSFTYYTVVSGDNLSSIAKRFGLTISRIVRDNPQLATRPHLLHIGEVIKIGK